MVNEVVHDAPCYVDSEQAGDSVPDFERVFAPAATTKAFEMHNGFIGNAVKGHGPHTPTASSQKHSSPIEPASNMNKSPVNPRMVSVPPLWRWRLEFVAQACDRLAN